MTEDLSILTRRASAPEQTLSYGADKDQVADIRTGRQGALRPLVVLIHGGFWKPQYDRNHTEAQACALATAGWTVLTLEYRRIPGHPDLMLDDLRTALAGLPDRPDRAAIGARVLLRRLSRNTLAQHSRGWALCLD